MKTEFDILISFRTPNGFKVCGQYALGDDRQFAESVFDALTGRDDPDNKGPLHLDLLETTEGLPVGVKTISCKVHELSANCSYIIRELFRAHAIEPK
jgi:hypothetical protein